MLIVRQNVTVRAENVGRAVLDGENERQVIKLQGGTVVLDGLYITNGSTPTGSAGGVYIQDAVAVVVNSIITTNHARDGAGIYVKRGVATLSSCVVNANHASREGGGLYARGGNTHLESCSIKGNRAGGVVGGDGGGLRARGGTLILSRCSLQDNEVIGCPGGGGAANIRSYTTGSLNVTLVDCSIFSNRACYGGGFYISGTSIANIIGCDIFTNKVNSSWREL